MSVYKCVSSFKIWILIIQNNQFVLAKLCTFLTGFRFKPWTCHNRQKDLSLYILLYLEFLCWKINTVLMVLWWQLSCRRQCLLPQQKKSHQYNSKAFYMIKNCNCNFQRWSNIKISRINAHLKISNLLCIF